MCEQMQELCCKAECEHPYSLGLHLRFSAPPWLKVRVAGILKRHLRARSTLESCAVREESRAHGNAACMSTSTKEGAMILRTHGVLQE